MRHSWRLRMSSIGAAAILLGMTLGGCSSASSQAVATEAPTSTPIPTATDAPPALATLADVEQPGCPTFETGPVPATYGAVAGLKVSIPERWVGLDFPSELMPNNQPNTPYKVPFTSSETSVGAFHPNPPVNPSLSTGYALQVCNQASAPRTVSGIHVNIASFTPSSGPITVWHICQGGPYDPATKLSTPGCGGAVGPVDKLIATLPGDRAGASAPAVANAQSYATGPDLPVTLGPGKSVVFLVAVDSLTSQGTYTLSFSVSVDGAASATLPARDGPFFIAPSPVIWTGTACQTPAMQAQIPTPAPDAYYVCPPAA